MRERDVEGWKYANDCALVVHRLLLVFSILYHFHISITKAMTSGLFRRAVY